jgi:hypothetical protein
LEEAVKTLCLAQSLLPVVVAVAHTPFQAAMVQMGVRAVAPERQRVVEVGPQDREILQLLRHHKAIMAGLPLMTTLLIEVAAVEVVLAQ